MQFISSTDGSSPGADGVTERAFRVGEVPGMFWTPTGANTGLPLVMLGHGGGESARHPGIVARARHYVSTIGVAVAAIDAPGHGERPFTEIVGVERALQTTADWRAVIDALLNEGVASGSIGYWGVSMGGVAGAFLLPEEPRISAAVLGLIGLERLEELAPRITMPLEFLLQWDDELVPHDEGLALFDAFGSVEKTLHANPGKHLEIPAFELESSARFFARHLRTTSSVG
ncbi:MAG: alpha/beta hydrolase [Pseudolysinimonas sp.]